MHLPLTCDLRLLQLRRGCFSDKENQKEDIQAAKIRIRVTVVEADDADFGSNPLCNDEPTVTMGCRSRGILNEEEHLIDSKLSILYISLCILLRRRHVMLARG